MQQLLEAADLLAGETAWECLGPPKTGKKSLVGGEYPGWWLMVNSG